MNNKEIICEDTLKYLGVIIDNKLSWTPHIDYLIESSKKFALIATKLMGYKFGLTPEIRNKIYKTIIESKLTYAARFGQSICNSLI